MADNILVFDTETTGLDTKTNELVEIAFQVISIDGKPIGKLMNTFVYTDTKIPEEATEVHKITNSMIVGAPKPAAVIKAMEKHCGYYGCTAILAHNINFDINTLNKYLDKDSPLLKLELIDTLRLARRLLNDADNHQLGTLCEYYNLSSTDYVGDYHSAGYDIAQTIELYKLLMEKLYDINSLEDLIIYHDSPIVIERMTFGKYRGWEISKVPAYYKQWLHTINLDIDLKYTLGVD